MAQSYQLISTQTLTSGTQSITFSNIPQNYTDLRILFSARVNTSGGYSNVKIGFNGSTSNITWRGVYAYGGTNVGSNTGSTERVAGNANANSSTSATFSNVDVYITNYTSTTLAKNMSADSVVESNDNTNPLLSFETNHWNPGTQAAITSIELTNSASPAANFDAGSTFYLYGIGGSRASGGTITADANYTYHTFTSTGTFTALERIRGAEALVIAGGGGGGSGGGGGGGAGGFRVVPGLLLPAGNTYPVTIGAGGAGGNTDNAGSAGNDSVFSTITSTAGGLGGGYNAPQTGGNGGSGGGGNGRFNNAGGSASPSGQGNNGGSGLAAHGGGGGGAGAAGANAGASAGGNGGIGTASYSAWGYATNTGQNVGNTYYYAGGGGAGSSGTGGTGGGGAAGNPGTSGTANTGGGGGGGTSGAGYQAGAGGSGLVIIRYPNS